MIVENQRSPRGKLVSGGVALECEPDYRGGVYYVAVPDGRIGPIGSEVEAREVYDRECATWAARWTEWGTMGFGKGSSEHQRATKLKIGSSGAVAPANPDAPLGQTPTGGHIVEVIGAPAATPVSEIVLRFSQTVVMGSPAHVYWDQLGAGKIVNQPYAVAPVVF